MPRRLPRADCLAALALLGLDLAAYGQLLDPGRMLADYDAFVYFYPLRAYAAAAVQEGRLPLWNPLTFLGVPFIANPQTAFFYPPTALFFWLAVPWAYGISLALHVLLAGLFFYAFCRLSLAVSPPAAWIGTAAFMLGGVLSGQYGHLNQISAVAWLPLVLLTLDRGVARTCRGEACLAWIATAAGLIGLQLLAGHPQQSYMTLIAAGLLCLWRAWPRGLRGLLRAAAVYAPAAVLGAGLAAIQLVPTAELAGLSIRGGGLSYRDAVADSLWPWLVARALLPSFVNDLGSTEFLGYVGVVPLLLAALALGATDSSRDRDRRLVLLAPFVALGLFLALGGANPLYPWLYAGVPGIASFRVPARWLLLYTIGVAGLAAVGLDWLLHRCTGRLTRRQWRRLIGVMAALGLLGLATYLAGARATRQLQLAWLGLALLGLVLAAGCAVHRTRRPALFALLALVGGELWMAGGDLAPRFPVPAEAYTQPRDSTLFVQSRLGADRFLSIASEEYELKETPDYREWYASLPESALQGFLVAAKRNEMLTPNLNLLYRIDDIDGYDGGLLPLRRFLALGSLLVPPSRLRPDGALISRLESLPSRALMDLLNVRVVLAGRSKDFDQGGVIYDRSILASLGPGERLELERVPRRSYTAVGLISSLEDDATPNAAAVAARLELVDADGGASSVPVMAGRDTCSSRAPTGSVAPPLELPHPWSWVAEGDRVECLARLSVPPITLARLAIVNVSPGSRLSLRAVSLIDERDGAFTPLVLDDRLERTGFFDMKVYEYPNVLGRAYLVHRAIEADDAVGLEVLGRPDFLPREAAIVEPGTGLELRGSGPEGDVVSTVETRPERVALRTASATAALLVLSDAFYPGWKVSMDGNSGRLIRTNVALRGVALPPGEHVVTFSYEPDSFRLGALISALSGLLLVALLLLPDRGGRGGMMRRRAELSAKPS